MGGSEGEMEQSDLCSRGLGGAEGMGSRVVWLVLSRE